MPVYVAGRINIDVAIEVNDVIARGRKYRGRVACVDVGGTAANIATAIARVDRSLSPVLLGAVGRDYAQLVFERLGQEGISLDHVKVLDHETGRAYIVLDSGGETTIITVPGANDYYLDAHVPRISDANAVVVGNTTPSAAARIIDSAPKGVPIFIDPHDLWTVIADRIALADSPCIYMPNESEFAMYAGVGVEDFEGLKEYHGRVGCSIVVKRGSRGAVAVHEDQLIEVSAVPLERLGLRVVSLSGCGDTFTGVFAAFYLRGEGFVESMVYASLAAALKATRISSRGCPTIEELKSFAETVEAAGLINVGVRRL